MWSSIIPNDELSTKGRSDLGKELREVGIAGMGRTMVAFKIKSEKKRLNRKITIDTLHLAKSNKHDFAEWVKTMIPIHN